MSIDTMNMEKPFSISNEFPKEELISASEVSVYAYDTLTNDVSKKNQIFSSLDADNNSINMNMNDGKFTKTDNDLSLNDRNSVSYHDNVPPLNNDISVHMNLDVTVKK